MTATARFVRHHALTAYAALVFAYLLVPIAIVILLLVLVGATALQLMLSNAGK